MSSGLFSQPLTRQILLARTRLLQSSRHHLQSLQHPSFRSFASASPPSPPSPSAAASSLSSAFRRLLSKSSAAKPVSVHGSLFFGSGLLVSLKASPLLRLVNSQAQEIARGAPGSALTNLEAKRAADLAAAAHVANKLKISRSGRWKWLRDSLFVLFRATRLSILFLPALTLGALTLLFPRLTKIWLDLLLNTLESAGPAFIKLGQWITTRPDIFPVSLCEALEKLHDDVHPHSFEETKKTIEEAFKVPFFDLFLEFDTVPLGVGCVAQVHKAILSPPYRTEDNPTGQVAVKVLHLRAIGEIEKDLNVIKFFAGVLNFCFPSLKWAGFSNSVSMFTTIMLTQLDLNVEAHNMARFRDNFKDFSQIEFAKPYFPLVSERVLVESFEEGVSISKFMKVKKGPWNRRIAEIGLDAFLQMALIDNFVHADLHPGNIFVLLNDSKKSQPVKLVFLDCGLVSELKEVDQENFVALFKAVAHGEGKVAAKMMIERTTGDTSKIIDPEGFVNEMDVLISAVMKNPLSRVKIGDVLGRVISLVRKHQVPLETNTTNLIMGIIILEGIGKQLDPTIDIFDRALDLLRTKGVNEGLKELDTWENRLALLARKIYGKVFGLQDQISADRV